MPEYDVIAFAKSELKKYFEKLNISAEIELGLFDEMGVGLKVKDPYFDDAVAISVTDSRLK